MSQSPRFELRQKEIAAVINKTRIKETWKSKVRSAVRDQFLPDPLDYYDYQLNINQIAEQLENLILSGSYTPRPAKRISQEKSKGLCRLLTIPNPIDLLVLQCLSDALYADIRNAQPTKKAFFEPEDHSLSGQDNLFSTPQYGSFKSWLDFQKEFLNSRKKGNGSSLLTSRTITTSSITLTYVTSLRERLKFASQYWISLNPFFHRCCGSQTIHRDLKLACPKSMPMRREF